MGIAWRVGDLVRARHWNAHQLAERAGVDVKTARNIIAGRATRVDLETIDRLAGALDVPVGALWRRVGPGPAPSLSAVAGAAGRATREEMDWVLGRRPDEVPEPGFERATRPS
jgi:DNA-binding Xre family transcriptional regulator